MQVIFLALATYTRQYFAVFFIYFLYRYFKALNLINFIYLFIICIITSLPVLFYTYLFPELLTEQHISIKSINYFLLGNSSIISIYLFPIIIINIFYKKFKIEIKNIFLLILSILIVFILSLNFDPINWQGGGVNFMISQNIFNNNLYFYFTSSFTFFVFLYLISENKENLVLLIILLFMFFSFQVYQRYYEPMFFIILFSLIRTNLLKVFFRNLFATFLLLFFNIIYYLLAVTDFIYNIK